VFGLFSKKSEGSGLRKHAERAANKRAQAVDRWDAIQALIRIGGQEAVAALLPRFTFYVDPSITDQEEKDAAFEGIVGIGAAGLPSVLAFLRKTDSISWPVKILDRITTPEAMVGALVEILDRMDVEYERDPQKKIQILAALEERRDVRIAQAAARFLDDANETARFHAVGAVLAQDERETQRDRLVACLRREESVRVKHRILDGFVAHQWALEPSDKALPAGYALAAGGRVQRAGS
jgi:hypothetical protein